MSRESMQVDVAIVGAGPAGLATACRLLQLSREAGREISVCVLEKGAEVGAHILSGAVFEPDALQTLFPDWQQRGAPLDARVTGDLVYYLGSGRSSYRFPEFLVPRPMRNHGNYIISLGKLCRWLAEQASELGAEIFPGFAATELLRDDTGRVTGVATGDMGVDAKGERKATWQPGFEFHAKFTILAEGCRGHLGKEAISHHELAKGRDPQHYGIGIKEIWEINPTRHQEGLVVHTAGWPMTGPGHGATSGGFLYHAANHQVFVGLIVDLGYANPHLSPFDEFQRYKHHPVIKRHLEGGKRIGYGARAVIKGGLNSLPEMSFPGGLLIGCDAGTLNPAKIKGSHTAIKSGILAADSLFAALASDSRQTDFSERFRNSPLHDELHRARNFGGAYHKFGFWLGSAFTWLEHNVFAGGLPFTLRNPGEDHCQLKSAKESARIDYPKPDGALSFDKMSSVYLSNTNHEEDQPCHLQLKDASIPVAVNLPLYDEPAQRYCPAGVYEVVEEGGARHFRINAQNCVHCKTCDIKDPAQNIEWVAPEGGGGPNYVAM